MGRETEINTTDDISFTVRSKSAPSAITSKTNKGYKPIGLIHLPDNVIVTYIGTYLHTCFLQALSSTCHRTYQAFLLVVPGMKLKLCPH